MSAHLSSSSHWKMQRLTAVGLIPLTLWFILSIASLATAEHAAVQQWIAAPLTAALLTLFIALGCYHAVLGMQVVLEDYLNEAICARAFGAIRLLLVLVAALGLIAIIQINLESL